MDKILSAILMMIFLVVNTERKTSRYF